MTNTYGIDKNYSVGLIHQYSVDYGRDLFKSWSVGATYFGTLGQNLDLLRAPNRTATGVKLEDVQSFTYIDTPRVMKDDGECTLMRHEQASPAR